MKAIWIGINWGLASVPHLLTDTGRVPNWRVLQHFRFFLSVKEVRILRCVANSSANTQATGFFSEARPISNQMSRFSGGIFGGIRYLISKIAI